MAANGDASPAVSVRELSVAYRSGGSDVPVAQEVSFEVASRGTLAIVGESGSGKTTVAGTLLGHLRHGSRVTGGSVRVAGRDVFALNRGELRGLRGRTVAMVGQNAGHALTPSMRVGRQIAEALRGRDRARRRSAVIDLLAQVRLPDPAVIAERYPHQLSGGQQQRVAIAMAIAARPRVLVLDEPTTGLDVITQKGVLELLRTLSSELALATVLVSHDLGVVARMADHVLVMREGRVVDAADAGTLFASPSHPYTRRLLASVPRIGDGGLVEVAQDGSRTIRSRPPRDEAPAVVSLDDVRIGYGGGRGRRDRSAARPAVDGVTLELRRGEALALVGESGSGKSTLAWSLAGLHAPMSGGMRCHGAASGDLSAPARRRPLPLRRRVQLVFQNADTSLNPRRAVREAVRRPLRFFGGARRDDIDERTRALIRDVELDPDLADRLPAQLSGGQRQRIGIARALAGGPDVVIADEITTALDVSVQAAVLRLLDDLRRERDLAFLFISHDLAVVRGIADRVAVLRHGRIVEEGPTEAVFAGPNHPYTRRLLDAVLEPDPAAARPGRADPGPAKDACGVADPGAAGDDDWIDRGGGHRIRRWDTESEGEG
ncbi:peptide/nickel transport system ATP-binding protein [Spinactinospora alkalitolerans]|uniref:Peptide/nickel transport system ATP-binding protein n=1 Tax=Spinactinospora alkalitolerans TaxID=687207 RepID=A0A852U3S0_9ACTN|nr:ABC transporter ATP-binding protein [Spinactinospora alkalitolerans]NYE50868.1 peptide/nickel transport system ATP-binding protein [Spinactinospora alkalitolerans]